MDQNTINQTQEPIVDETQEPSQEQMVNETQEQTEKLFTQDELNEIIKKRLAKEKGKYEQELREQLQREQDEAARLAKMSASEREKEKFRLEREKFEQEKQQFAKERLLMETNKQLLERNLPTDFAEYLISDSAETTLENINSFETKWTAALSSAVNNKIVGSSPKVPETNNKSNLTIDEIKNMSMDEVMANYESVTNALKYTK